MIDAPERIWACASKNTKSGVVTLLGDATFPVDGWQEYVRADRIAALTEQLAAARHDAEEAEAYAGELEANGLANRVAIMRLEAKLAECEARLGKAVDALEKIAKFDHQKEAQRILTITVEQPAAMHLRAEKSEERVQAEYQLIKSVAQTDIQCWAHMAITELTGGKDE